jgi:cytochrome c-type biogenesis protein
MDISQGISASTLLFSLWMGAVSFISPCILPLIPSYVSYITGISYDDLVDSSAKKKNLHITLYHSLVFVGGFSVVLVILGATVSLIGQMLIEHLSSIRIGGGILMIVLGLFVAEVIPIPFLQREAKLHLKSRPAGYVGTFIVGIVFAAGWTPCTGPFLSSVLMQAAQADTMATGMVFLAFYSLGIGVPFILSAVAISAFLTFFNRLKRHYRAIKIISGAVLIIMGILLIADKWTLLTSYLTNP